ncbi:hypothetical protein HDV05_001177 [Chytridiales sp. JEL 0842]|nr:hypothetical protein HDV05_001177 [Chytridiales sp. JEL 0842]
MILPIQARHLAAVLSRSFTSSLIHSQALSFASGVSPLLCRSPAHGPTQKLLHRPITSSRSKHNGPSKPDSKPSPSNPWQSLIERQILLAERKGVFKNLEGHGKPLLDNLEFQMNKVLASQREVPIWVELKRQVEKEIRKFREEGGMVGGGGTDFTTEADAKEKRLKRIRDINDKVLQFNVVKPNSIPAIPTLPLK